MSNIQNITRIGNIAQLPPAPQIVTTVKPLLSADDIYPMELAVIQSTPPCSELYVSQYTLPSLSDGPSVGTPASDAQRQILAAILEQMQFNFTKVFIIADNSGKGNGAQPRNAETMQFLREQGACILPYPSQYVSINHSKIVANSDYSVIASANLSAHQADSPDLNTGFLFTGAAARNAALHAFLPQWEFAVKQDTSGCGRFYPKPRIQRDWLPDTVVTWLNTAPGYEIGLPCDQKEIKSAYLNAIWQAKCSPGGYLYIEHCDLSERGIAFTLAHAKKDNPDLDIRVILDPNMYAENSNPHSAQSDCYQTLIQAGIPVKFAYVNPRPPGPEGTHPQIFHNKWMVCNDREVINGSGNLSFESLDGNYPALTPADFSDPNNKLRLHNREVDVDVVDEASAKAYKEKFLEDWSSNATEDAAAAALGKI